MKNRPLKINDPENPLVSILTVCFNSEKYIKQAIQSVLGQTYENIQYIIIDGNSTDGTVKIIKDHENDLDVWVSEPDEGIYDALNKGIRMAKGELVGHLHSDNWYHPRAVERVVAAYRQHPRAHLFYGNVFRVTGPDEHVLIRGSHENLLKKWSIPHSGCFLRKSLYDEHLFDTRYKITADYDLVLKFWIRGKTFCHVDEVVSHVRVVGISRRPRFQSVLDRYAIRRQYDPKIAAVNLAKETLVHLDEVLYSQAKKVNERLDGTNHSFWPRAWALGKKIVKFVAFTCFRLKKS